MSVLVIIIIVLVVVVLLIAGINIIKYLNLNLGAVIAIVFLKNSPRP